MRTIRARALTLASAAILSGAAFSGAHAQSNELTLCWAAWDPANALVELSKDFTAETGIEMNFEFVPWPNFADRMLNELNSQRQALRPDDRRQPVDRRLRRERPLRQAQRLLRQGRHHDGRLRAGHRRRLFRMAEGHAELLGAAGHGRRARLDLPQGLVRAARASRPSSRRSTAATSRRPRPGPSSRRSPSSSRAARSTARRSTAPRSSPSAAPKASPWASPTSLYAYGFKYENPEKPYDMEGFVNSPDAVDGARVLQGALQVLHAAGLLQRLHERRPRRLQVGPGGDADELVRLLARACTRTRTSAATRSASSSIPAENGAASHARRPGHLGRRPTPTTRTRRSSTSSGSPSPRCRRSGGRSAATPAAKAVLNDPASPTASPSRPTSSIDGEREGLLGGADLRRAAAGHAEARP